MVDILLGTILVGSAVFYVIEAVDYFLSIFFDVRRSSLNLLLSTPLAVGAFYLLGFWGIEVLVASLGAALVTSLLGLFVNKPTIIRQKRPYL